jgi:hypothetical protein
MEGFVWGMLGLVMLSGMLASIYDSEEWLGMQLACMFGLIIGVPILSVILYM